MAIQPIDLQTMFTQIDKVGKEQASLRDGQTLHQAVLGEQAQKKLEQQIKSVNDVQNTGEGTEPVNDRESHQEKKEGWGRRKEQEEKQKPSISGTFVVRDPALGKNVDFSG
jgi:hypothetical protein